MSDTGNTGNTGGMTDWSSWREQVDLDEYDQRWQRIAASGQNPHGEADLVASFRPRTVVDAGCGTGRVAIELARRGIDVVGVDLDADMLEVARAKAPVLTWVQSDLAGFSVGHRVDLVVMAGNVIPFVAAPQRPAAVLACATLLEPGGRLVAGFQLQPTWPTLDDYDGWCAAAELTLEDRWSTWDRRPYAPGGSYAVSVHRR